MDEKTKKAILENDINLAHSILSDLINIECLSPGSRKKYDKIEAKLVEVIKELKELNKNKTDKHMEAHRNRRRGKPL